MENLLIEILKQFVIIITNRNVIQLIRNEIIGSLDTPPTTNYLVSVNLEYLIVGMRKALQAEMGKVETERKIKELEGDKHDLERQCNELKNRCEQVEKRGIELRQVGL